MATFCPHPESWPEAKIKNFELITLVEEILKQSSIDSFLWLLLAMLVKIYNKRRKLIRVNYKTKQK